MSAFAAILPRTPWQLPREVLQAIADALEDAVGRAPAVLESSHCTFLHAPLHDTDPATPMRHGEQIVAGTAMFEDSADLARGFDLPPTAPALRIAAAARDRWGDHATEQLSGEFAIAGWDGARQAFWCARDGIGVRLLYIGEGPDAIVVSNVLGAILASGLVPATIDDAAVVEFLARGYSVDPAVTPYRQIALLPGGHTLHVPRGGSPVLRRHWRMPAPSIRRRISRDEVREAYREALARAVRDRLRNAGTALLLSGGLDSTTIAATARRIAPATPLHAVTAAYRRFVPDFTEETRLASAAAAHLHIPLVTIGGDDFDPLEAERAGEIPPMLVDEPALADWRALIRAASDTSTVVLNGEDGDSLFAAPGGRELLRNMGPGALARAVATYSIANRMRPYLGLRSRPKPAPPFPRWLSREALRVLDTADPRSVLGCAPTPPSVHPTRQRTQDRLLTAIDTFATSISPEVTRCRAEIRLPLMDSRVIACVFSAPPIPWCQQKALARDAFSAELPAEILRRPKTPVRGYFEGAVQAWRARGGVRCPGGIADWIDADAWEAAIGSGSPLEVTAAWRALHAGAWLERAPRSREAACTT